MKSHKQRKLSPPCGTCENGTHNAPVLLEENRDAWDLWKMVNTQWRAGGFGLLGLDYSEVRRMAGDLEITLDVPEWRKIKALERSELARLNRGKDVR